MKPHIILHPNTAKHESFVCNYVANLVYKISIGSNDFRVLYNQLNLIT